MKKIKGEIDLPGDKSISHRSALFSSFIAKKSTFSNFNFNQDCSATLACVQALGVDWRLDNGILEINGKKLANWNKPANLLDAENSGTTARLISGLLANLSFSTRLSGDDSLQKRPMKRILDPLSAMGADIQSNNNYLPLQFNPSGSLQGIRYTLPMASAQVKSAVLLAGLFADGQTEVVEPVQTRDHTERMLQLKKVKNDDGSQSVFSSSAVHLPDISMRIPGDFSSAAFFIVAALMLPGSELTLKNVSLNPTRTGFLAVLEKMGARFEINQTQSFPEPAGDIFVKYQSLNNIVIPLELVPNIIDEIPVLAVLASQTGGQMQLKGAQELRHKESDRLMAIAKNLRAVGVEVEEFDDGLNISGLQSFTAGKVSTFGDHRIAMSFAIANLLTDDQITIDDRDCVAVSFPQFWDILARLAE